MSILLAIGTAAIAGLVIDRVAFRGELTGMIVDEFKLVLARRRRPSKAPRTARRGVGAR